MSAYPFGIDELTDADLSSPLPPEDESLDVHPDAFLSTSGFLRSGEGKTTLVRYEPGPAWTFDESDLRSHEFLAQLVGGRDLDEHLEDPIAHARVNSLMLLFSAEAQEVFETYLQRMPEPRVAAWRELIGGGASSEAFGPLTLKEQLDERQVDEALQVGRKQRRISLVVGAVMVVVAGVGSVVAWQVFGGDEERTTGTIRFEPLDEDTNNAGLVGGPPVVSPELTAALTETVAVLAGDGPREERITVAPFSTYPYPPGALRASLFQYAGVGQIVIVGPDGFVENTCLRASVVTTNLRPLDIVTHGPCVDPVGRAATVGCIGASAVMLDLVVPAGEVTLPEGGAGFADAVRVQLIAEDGAYELLTIRATISVALDADVVVPRFGGAPGDELTFDLGAERVGICTLTGPGETSG